MNKLIIIGAGGHGKVVADAARSMNKWENIAFLDDQYPKLINVEEWKVIGNIKSLSDHPCNTTDIAVALGHNFDRVSMISKCKNDGYCVPVITHSSATVACDVQIGDGSVLLANSVVNIGAKIGEGNIINTSSVVEHDCKMGNGVHLSPGVNVAGGVVVGDNSWIGIGASVINNIVIGSNTIIGAGAVVVCNVEDNVVAYGVPAKMKRRV